MLALLLYCTHGDVSPADVPVQDLLAALSPPNIFSLEETLREELQRRGHDLNSKNDEIARLFRDLVHQPEWFDCPDLPSFYLPTFLPILRESAWAAVWSLRQQLPGTAAVS